MMPQQMGGRAMTNAEKQAAAREREKRRGIIRMLVRIPAEDKARLEAFVAELMAAKAARDSEEETLKSKENC